MAQPQLNGSIDLQDLPPEPVIFGRSSGMAVARKRLELAASTDVPVLLQGNSGTGKEIISKLLHIKSRRARFSWIKVICPAIPNTLIESELFGYEKGAFTGAYTTKRGRVELAHNGTLFLDEVGSLDPSVQAKLLQLLQDGSFMRIGDQEVRSIDARIVSSANVDLADLAEKGSFRSDFLYRLNAVTIYLPPLRQRVEDLPVLIDFFMDRYARLLRREPRPMDRDTIRLMEAYDWPGNIRQLENMIRSYVLIGSDEAFSTELVPRPSSDLAPDIDLASPISLKQITKSATERLERQIILKVLQANGGSRRKTAQWLNISYRSLLYKLDGVRSRGIATPD